jgi:hypothetical protein
MPLRQRDISRCSPAARRASSGHKATRLLMPPAPRHRVRRGIVPMDAQPLGSARSADRRRLFRWRTGPPSSTQLDRFLQIRAREGILSGFIPSSKSRNPSPSAPNRFSTGTLRPSMKTSFESTAFRPILAIGRMSTDARSIGASNSVMPSVRRWHSYTSLSGPARGASPPLVLC